MDADFAQETANMSRAQILQQAGTAMVAQANQLPQNVLSLLVSLKPARAALITGRLRGSFIGANWRRFAPLFERPAPRGCRRIRLTGQTSRA